MLTAQGPFISHEDRGGEWILAAIVGGSLLVVLLQAAYFACRDWQNSAGRDDGSQPPAPTTAPLGMALLGAGCASTSSMPTQPAAAARHVGYLLPFEIVSVHLLVVLDRRRLPGPSRRSVVLGPDLPKPDRDSEVSCSSQRTMNLLTQPVGVSHYLVVGRGAVRGRRRLHGHQAQCAGRADGHRAGAQRGEPQFRRLRQRVPAAHGRIGIGLDGQLIALFVIVLAAAEAAVALAITLNFYNNHSTVDVDRADEFKG